MTSKEKIYGRMVEDKIYFIKQFDYLGISKNYTGYFMLVDIMGILINQDKSGESFSKEIYPIVAKNFNKTECTVERNIRNLIDKSWSIELIEKLNVYRKVEDKPTCIDFVFMIKNFIVKQLF